MDEGKEKDVTRMVTFEWELAALIAPREGGDEARFALVMLNQPIQKMALVRDLWQRCKCIPAPRSLFHPLHLVGPVCLLVPATDTLTACLRVAADGGANELHELSKSTAASPFVSLCPHGAGSTS